MILLTASGIVRWSLSDGDVGAATTAPSVTVSSSASAGTVTATVASGTATLSASDMAVLVPAIGEATLTFSDGMAYTLERVGSRYCTPADVISYGSENNDDFKRFDDSSIRACIQHAEEVIEAGTGRSFCTRAADVLLRAGSYLVELPMQDAISVSDTSVSLVSDRQCTPPDADVTAKVTYGAACDASVHIACIKLAASYLRPRVGAENASGTAVDGVYVSYSLATGAEGGWTGLPSVDSTIESHRSHRRLVV